MKVTNVRATEGSVVINYVDKDGNQQSYWANGTTDVASATQSFVTLYTAGLLWPALYNEQIISIPQYSLYCHKLSFIGQYWISASPHGYTISVTIKPNEEN